MEQRWKLKWRQLTATFGQRHTCHKEHKNRHILQWYMEYWNNEILTLNYGLTDPTLNSTNYGLKYSTRLGNLHGHSDTKLGIKLKSLDGWEYLEPTSFHLIQV